MSSQTIGGTNKQRTGSAESSRIREAGRVPMARTPVPPRASRPAPPEPEVEQPPAAGRLAGLCGWAALLGFLGVAVGGRGLVAILVKAPDWYEPTLITLGLSGIALAVVAFLTVHYRYVPWLFLTLSSGVLLASIIVTGAAT